MPQDAPIPRRDFFARASLALVALPVLPTLAGSSPLASLPFSDPAPAVSSWFRCSSDYVITSSLSMSARPGDVVTLMVDGVERQTKIAGPNGGVSFDMSGELFGLVSFAIRSAS